MTKMYKLFIIKKLYVGEGVIRLGQNRGKYIVIKGALAIGLLISNFNGFGASVKATALESQDGQKFESEEILYLDEQKEENKTSEIVENTITENLDDKEDFETNIDSMIDDLAVLSIEGRSNSRASGSGLVQLWQVVPEGQEWKEGKSTSEIMSALQCKPNHNLYASGGQTEQSTYVNSCYVDDALYLGEDTNYYYIYLSGYEGKVPKSESHWFELDLNNDGVKTSYEIQTVAYYIPASGVTYRLQEVTEPLDVPELDYYDQYLNKYQNVEEARAYSIPTVQSPSYYANENGTLIHYITNNVTKANNYSKVTVGKAPNWMSSGVKYYSYDGVYFYTHWSNIKVNGQGAINQSNPFYNYYQYLPFRSKSTYESTVFDAYTNSNGGSGGKLVNTGQYFYAVQDNYGINGALQYAMGIHESGWGKSSLSLNKNNLFGMNATDNNPYGNGTSFPSVEAGINYHADHYLSQGYTNVTGDWRYVGSHVGNKGSGMNVRYASDPFWGEKIAGWYYRFDSASGLKDYNYYTIGIKQSNSVYNIRLQANTSSSVLYQTKNQKSNFKFPAYPVLITGEQNGFYQIQSDMPINGNGVVQNTAKYDWNNTSVFISKDAINVLNHTNYQKIPTSYYKGDMNSQLTKISLGSNDIGTYINGEIIIVEWIDGQSTVPNTLPAMKLKSTDGKVSYDMFVTPTGTNTYYFDSFINHVDLSKEYYIEVSSSNPFNNSSQKSMNVTTYGVSTSKNLGTFNKRNVKYTTTNNLLKLYFEEVNNNYIGNINSELRKISLGSNDIGTYLNGEIIIVEWIDGQSHVPTTLPAMKLKSTDGKQSYDMFITPTGTNTYYFDIFINHVDLNKEYYIEAILTNTDNKSSMKTMNVVTDNAPQITSSATLGQFSGKNVSYYTDGKTLKLTFPENSNKYIGNVNSELKRIELLPNNIGTYLTGEFVIVEWINGQSTVPTTTPRVVLKSTDGTINHEMFITPTGTNTYYFDSYIHEMDASKEYYVEVSLTHPDNVSPNKSMYLRTDTSPAISDSGILGYMNGKTVSFYSAMGEMVVTIK